MTIIHHSQDLIYIFNDLFEQSEQTILLGNGDEPIYLPADDECPLNRIIFTRDYFASALHEIAHWCIASAERRKQVDYGYWYFPEGRNAVQQALFEQAEVKPQAIECIFSKAAGSLFIVSQDNLMAGAEYCPRSFENKIIEQVQHYQEHGLPDRAQLFKNKLVDFYFESRSAVI